MVHHKLRAQDVVEWATIGGARALGLAEEVGSLTPGKKADLVLIKNDRYPAMFPILHPYGHVAYQAGRGDVHTVLVNGKVVKFEHRLLTGDLDHARVNLTAAGAAKAIESEFYDVAAFRAGAALIAAGLRLEFLHEHDYTLFPPPLHRDGTDQGAVRDGLSPPIRSPTDPPDVLAPGHNPGHRSCRSAVTLLVTM